MSTANEGSNSNVNGCRWVLEYGNQSCVPRMPFLLTVTKRSGIPVGMILHTWIFGTAVNIKGSFSLVTWGTGIKVALTKWKHYWFDKVEQERKINIRNLLLWFLDNFKSSIFSIWKHSPFQKSSCLGDTLKRLLKSRWNCKSNSARWVLKRGDENNFSLVHPPPPTLFCERSHMIDLKTVCQITSRWV